RWKTHYPAGTESSLVLPCLRRLQQERGHITDADIERLAAYLPTPRRQIEEVLSLYTHYRRAPLGANHGPVGRHDS
ncbi:MAG: NAD(P)H-dependent oxidoreductase subunit E, partial [Burkholderiaceae bacterium]